MTLRTKFKKEYDAWCSMRRRCYSANHGNFSNYGGRGIEVCARWFYSFELFLKDLGPCPTPEHSLDRIRVHEGYGPDNCRWATKEEQDNNKQKTLYITYQGKKQSLALWAKEVGIPVDTLTSRWRRKWTVDKMFTTPVDKKFSTKKKKDVPNP